MKSMAQRLRLVLLIVLGSCVMASHAWGQLPLPGAPRLQPSEPEGEEVEPRPSPLLRIPALAQTMGPTFPGLGNYPLELLGLLMSPLERREFQVLPSIAVSGEFNDNIFMNNDNRRWEYITGFTPALMLLANRPQFQLVAGVSNTSELYARDSIPNDAFARQDFVAGLFWAPTPQLAFTVANTFLRDQNPDALAGGFTVGQASWTNTLAPGMGWQVAPQTRLDVSGLYNVARFDDPGAAIDSDTYGVLTSLSHGFTPHLTGMIGYNFTYLDLRSGHGDNATTHTPMLGFTYRVTPTLTFSINGGPAFTDLGSESFITPAGSAGLVQRLPFGTASLFYSRNVAVAGGFGGPTDAQTVTATLLLPTWKDWLVVLTPAWTKADSLSTRQLQRVDVTVFTVILGAAYRFNDYITAFGGYSFLRQRVGRSSTTPDVDADQSRVRFGVQFGYPLAFDLPW